VTRQTSSAVGSASQSDALPATDELREAPDLKETIGPEPPQLAVRAATMHAFLALCQRDAFATLRRDPWGFLAQSLIAPLFYLFIFGRVLPEIGAAGPRYGVQLLPGVIGLTLVLTALQGVALSLVIEFSFTKEIEDRLLAPIPAALVGVQKLVWAAVRGIVAGLVILPLGELVLPGGLHLGGASWPAFAVLLVAGGVAGASIGLVMGTAVPANKINVVFAVVLTPLLFTGATFYPWQSLDSLRWFQVITLFNPLTYVSEGMRGALTAGPHLGTGWIALGLVVSIGTLGTIGVRKFIGRAVD
jgi:ABC-2 type transport system permease protein